MGKNIQNPCHDIDLDLYPTMPRVKLTLVISISYNIFKFQDPISLILCFETHTRTHAHTHTHTRTHNTDPKHLFV